MGKRKTKFKNHAGNLNHTQQHSHIPKGDTEEVAPLLDSDPTLFSTTTTATASTPLLNQDTTLNSHHALNTTVSPTLLLNLDPPQSPNLSPSSIRLSKPTTLSPSSFKSHPARSPLLSSSSFSSSSSSSSTVIPVLNSTPPLSPSSPSFKHFPLSVFFIIGNEFCERFTFYGIKAILFIYLTQSLMFPSNSATAAVHAFNVLAYCCTFLGAILSDAYWGRFKTIVVLSFVYCFGSLILSISSAIPSWALLGLVLGLTCLALGTGGIKPCVSAFGADQLPKSHLSLYFSWFYFAINSGSFLSMLVTPLLRAHQCLNQPHCFPLAFGLPSVLMCISTFIFLLGTSHYQRRPASGNILMQVIQAMKSAWKHRHRFPKQPHWMDYALFDEQWTPSFIKDVKQFCSVLYVFLPLPIFWTLYDQQASRWTAQALQLNPHFSFFGIHVTLQPDQMQVTNALLILILIPFFQHSIYPRLPSFTALKKMKYGMVFTGVSFCMASYLQTYIHSTTLLDPHGVCESNCLPMYVQFPQYLCITIGEILFSITGLEFAYQVAPMSMKSVCQSAWLLTVALGNVYVILIVALGDMALSQEFLFYGVLMFLTCVVFHYMTKGMQTNFSREEEEVIPSSFAVRGNTNATEHRSD